MKLYNEEFGFDENLNFDPHKYKSKGGAAKALYQALREKAVEHGQDPDSEVFIRTPEECEEAGYGRNWQVSWEAGPYEWAIGASFQVENHPHWFTEPYYSFDLCFTD